VTVRAQLDFDRLVTFGRAVVVEAVRDAARGMALNLESLRHDPS
jgi:hypothetical protein